MYFSVFDEFQNILRDTEEAFITDIYRPSTTVNASGEVDATLSMVDTTPFGTWFYPPEVQTVTIEGEVFDIDVIFFLEPHIQVKQGDILVALDKLPLTFRVGAITNFRTHLEVSCVCPTNERCISRKYRAGEGRVKIRG